MILTFRLDSYTFFFALNFLFLCALPCAYAEEGIALQMQRAHALSQAKEYNQAREVYQEMLQEPLAEWQRNTILYNLGSLLLASGNYDEAIEILNVVQKSSGTSPVIYFRSAYNLALAHLTDGIHLLKSRKPKTAKLHFQETLNEINVAERAHCQLEEIEGNSGCTEMNSLLIMKQLAEKYLKEANSSKEEEPETSGPEQSMENKKEQRSQKEEEQQKVLNKLLQMSQEESMSEVQTPKKKELRPW